MRSARFKRRLWGALLLALAGPVFGSLAQTNLQPVRLAILSPQPALRAAMDLLVAEFSKRDTVAVLERAEIERVFREQSLSLASRDAVKLGRLLGGDGVLMAGMIREGTNEFLPARLVAVRPGVVVGAVRSLWPVSDSVQWAAWVATRFDALLPKLQVPLEKVRPISVLNLRASVASRSGREMEEQLTALLLDRLSHERELFVLERRRMEWLARELEWGDAVEAEFWSGGYLLGAVIDRDGFSPERTTIHARLTAPGGAEPIELASEGPRTDLTGVIENLVEKIIVALRLSRSATLWQREAEARRFFEEGNWAMRWGTFREAQAALESSWALGLQNKEVAALRIRAWRQTGLNENNCNLDRELGVVSFGRPFVANFFEGTQIRFQSPPDPERFADHIYALTLFEQGFDRFMAGEPTLDRGWLTLGNDLLNDATDWLRQFYFTVEARAGFEDQIANARNQALRVCNAIRSHPAWRTTDANLTTLATLARGIAFWSETPEQALALYGELAAAGDWPKVRRRFLKAGDFRQEGNVLSAVIGTDSGLNRANPPLAGWTWADRRRAPALWNQFVGELCNSTNPMLALEGKFLRCSSAWTGEEFEQGLRDLVESRHVTGLMTFPANRFEESSRDLMESPLRPDVGGAHLRWMADLWADVDQLVRSRLGCLDSKRAQRIRDEIWNGVDAARKSVAPPAEHHATFEQAKEYFRNQNRFDLASFVHYLAANFTTEQARELLPLVKAYRQRVAQPAIPQTEPRSPDIWVGRLESKLQKQAAPHSTNPPVPVSAQVARPTKTGSVQLPPAHYGALGTTSPVVSAARGPPAAARKAPLTTNVLRDAKFWWAVPEDATNIHDLNLSVGGVCWREGRIWIEVWDLHAVESWPERPQLVLCAIDPDTWHTERIVVEADKGELGAPSFLERHTRRVFEVHNGSLYVATGERLRRYSRRQRKWETLPIPLAGRVQPQRLGEELYLTTPDSILAFKPWATAFGFLPARAGTRRSQPWIKARALSRHACSAARPENSAWRLAAKSGRFTAEQQTGRCW